jgi:CheY-like chemotaxis protein
VPDASTARLRILVIEDSRATRELIAQFLSDRGYDVVSASNGQDGLAVIERQRTAPPALVVLDLILPYLDGVAFAEELRRRGLRPRNPLLVLSVDRLGREKAEQFRAEGFLAKPFELDALLGEVERLTV